MAKKQTNKPYYGELQEQAVIKFLNAETVEEKQKIYSEFLEKPINRMIEMIIKTYRLYRKSYEFRDLHTDALSFLITKFDKFNPAENKKSFSYFGTICRNYLYGEMVKEYKRDIKHIDYDQITGDLMERDDMIYYIDNECNTDLTLFIKELVTVLRNDLENNQLTPNEVNVGYALVNVLDNWGELFNDVHGSSKFNKNLVLLYLRDITGLTTKEIRNAMKRFKPIYQLFKGDYFEY